MNEKQKSFKKLLHEFSAIYDLRTVFDDFLTMTLCSFSQNPLTGKSHDEDLYMETIRKYKSDPLRHHFPKALDSLVTEMEHQMGMCESPDILGVYYEQYLYSKRTSQYFTPWPVCMFMSSCLFPQTNEQREQSPLRILDPSCGSGRMLMAGAAVHSRRHEFYGIDIDHTCVKMTALNLFLSGVFHGEVMWADAVNPDSFYVSYRLSFLPFGIFRIKDKEQSRLWHMHGASFGQKPAAKMRPFSLPSEERNKGERAESASQLKLL